MSKRGVDQQRQGAATLASLYEECYPKIARYIAAKIGDRNEAEDMAGEVFLRAIESIGSYKDRGVPVQAWLFRIAHNLIVDRLRKATGRKTLPLDLAYGLKSPNTTEPEDMMVRKLAQQEVREAVKELTPAQQEVVLLRFVGGLTSEETAAVLKKKSGAVREMQSAAVRALRKRLQQEPSLEGQSQKGRTW